MLLPMMSKHPLLKGPDINSNMGLIHVIVIIKGTCIREMRHQKVEEFDLCRL